MKKDNIQNRRGLRTVILKRNEFSDQFAEQLTNCLKYDNYLKVLDVSLNQIGAYGLKLLIKHALRDNQSLVCFDARYNPGCSEKYQKHIALCLLKNIEQFRK